MARDNKSECTHIWAVLALLVLLLPSGCRCDDIASRPTFSAVYSTAETRAQRTRGEMFRVGLIAAAQARAPSYVVRPGVYRLPGGNITLSRAENMVIFCAGVTFITESAGNLINFSVCKNITLRGPVVWDTTVLPYCQGRIISIGTDFRSFHLQLLPGYVLVEAEQIIRRFHVFDSSGKLLDWQQQRFLNATAIGDGRVRVQLSQPLLDARQTQIGNIVALEGRTGEGHAMMTTMATYYNCANMSLEHVTIYTGAGHLYEGGTTGFSKQINVRCVTPKNTNRLIAGQPTQHILNSGSLVYERCEFGVGWVSPAAVGWGCMCVRAVRLLCL
jgi:hypothetical protein